MADALGDVLDVASPPVTVDEVEALARARFGLDGRATALTGERDRNFHVQTRDGSAFVLKVVHPAEPADVTDLQSALLLHVAASAPDLPVPRLVKPLHGDSLEFVWTTADHPTRRVRCLTYLAGCPLHRTVSTATQRRHLGACLAWLDLALRDFNHPADGHDLLWDIKFVDRVRPFLADILDGHKRTLAEAAIDRFADEVTPVLPHLRQQVIHNDFNPHNVLVDDAAHDVVAGVIDFGDVVRSPLVQDLAVAAAYQIGATDHPLQAVADTAAGFHAVCPLTSDEIELLPAMIAARLALTMAISSWRAARHPDNAPYILRNQSAAWIGLQRLHTIPRGEDSRWLRSQIAKA